MSKNIFGKPEPQCRYCEHGSAAAYSDSVVCKKAGGVMSPFSKCKKFKYDPLKREPSVITLNKDFDSSDFFL